MPPLPDAVKANALVIGDFYRGAIRGAAGIGPLGKMPQELVRYLAARTTAAARDLDKGKTSHLIPATIRAAVAAGETVLRLVEAASPNTIIAVGADITLEDAMRLVAIEPSGTPLNLVPDPILNAMLAKGPVRTAVFPANRRAAALIVHGLRTYK